MNGLRPLERSVAQAVADAAAHRPDARLRDDVDEEPAGVVVLGRERVARDVDRLDLRLRRQPPRLRSCRREDGVGAGHVLELLAHLVRIVRQRVDLLARQRAAERRARIAAAACLSRPTVTELEGRPRQGNVCRFSPLLTFMSRSIPMSNPANSASSRTGPARAPHTRPALLGRLHRLGRPPSSPPRHRQPSP